MGPNQLLRPQASRPKIRAAELFGAAREISGDTDVPFSIRTRQAFFAATVTVIFSILPISNTAQAQPGVSKKAPDPSSLTPEEARKFQKEKKAREDRKKISVISKLIQDINKKIKLRTSGQEVFDRKQELENRLRDKITLFKMTDQATSEANRLAREVEEIHRTNRNGPQNSRRQQLANFLEARRREYITFATR